MSNISSCKDVLLTSAVLLAVSMVVSSVAYAERCEPLPNNQYEKIFCDLKRSGRGATLPNIYQFRDNTPLTQALLLKKPAERAGIKIEIPERNNEETLKRQEELLVSAPADQNAGPVPLKRAVTTIKVIQQAPVKLAAVEQPEVVTETKPIVQPARIQPVVETAVPAVMERSEIIPAPLETIATEVTTNTSLTACSLQQLTLQCANGRYQLVGNKTNQQLSDKALSDEHKLALPVYSGATSDTKALEDYLAKAYDRYLQGMTEIGLGASTMSYTKFVNLHNYIVGQHVDFVARFETMYEFLKKDKAAIGVSTKLTIAPGLTFEYCSQLENFIACDYQKNNYVFAKAMP